MEQKSQNLDFAEKCKQTAVCLQNWESKQTAEKCKQTAEKCKQGQLFVYKTEIVNKQLTKCKQTAENWEKSKQTAENVNKQLKNVNKVSCLFTKTEKK